MKTFLKLRMLALAALIGFAAAATSLSAAKADEYPTCGTRYPGWWWHIHGPKSVTDILKVVNISFSSPVQSGGALVYSYRFVLYNYGRGASPASMPFSIGHNVAGSAGYWSPDQPFDPNNPINPYASLSFETSLRGSLPSLKPGQQLALTGKASIPLSMVQMPQANILMLNVGYDDGDDICPPYPFPNWPWPWPWWITVENFDPQINSLLPAVQTQLLAISQPQSTQWKGYGGYDTIFQITNHGRTTIQGGALIGLLHTVNMNNGNPNPDDPFNPRSPGSPYAEIFRELTVAPGTLLPTLQPGQSFRFKAHITAPFAPGYGSLLTLQIGK